MVPYLMVLLYIHRYAKIEISASSPIVPFRETIVPIPQVDMVNEAIQDQGQAGRSEKWREFEDDDEVIERGLVRIYTPNKKCMVQVRALPLPVDVTNLLDENQVLIKTLDQYVTAKLAEKNKTDIQVGSKLKQSTKEAIKEFKDKLEGLFEEAGKQWKGFVENIWAFGPKRVGPNLLVNKVKDYSRTCIWDCLIKDKKESKMIVRDYDYSVVSGFQLATLMGPLCDEPMRGVCFVIESWEVNTSDKVLGGSERLDIQLNLLQVTAGTSMDELSNNLDRVKVNTERCEDIESDTAANGLNIHEVKPQRQSVQDMEATETTVGQMSVQGYVSGQLMSIVKEACQKSFQTQPQRLMAAMYKCTIQATADVLGRCSVISGKKITKKKQKTDISSLCLRNKVRSVCPYNWTIQYWLHTAVVSFSSFRRRNISS